MSCLARSWAACAWAASSSLDSFRARHHPLRVYAFLELGIGLIGLLALFGIPLVNGVYTAWAGHGIIGILFRGVIAGICLLPPTILMGATLPAISRWLETTPQGVSWLGFFYGGNIAGAVLGSVLAGFYLLRVFDSAVATYVAVARERRGCVAGLARLRASTPTPAQQSDGLVAQRRAWRRVGLRRDRTVGDDGARRGSGVDSNSFAVVRRDGLYVFTDSGGLSRRPRHWQQPSARRWRETWPGREWRWRGASCSCAWRSRGRPTS